MRNIERLDKFYDELKQIHKEYFPDWRFGQLCSNFFGWLAIDKKIDLFFPEEDKMVKYIKEYANSHSIWKRDEYEYDDCEPEEPEKTQITLKTEETKNPFAFAFKIMQEEMQKTREIKGEIYHVWQSNLAMMLFDAIPKMTSERANEIAMKWLDRLFEINQN